MVTLFPLSAYNKRKSILSCQFFRDLSTNPKMDRRTDLWCGGEAAHTTKSGPLIISERFIIKVYFGTLNMAGCRRYL